MQRIIEKCKRHFILPHILFWMISIGLFIVLLVFTREDFSIHAVTFRFALNVLITIVFLALAVYINLLWLIPAFFNKRRFCLFFLLEIGNILLFIFLNYYASFFMEGGKHPNFVTEVVAEFILVLIFLIVTTLLKFTRDSITLQEVELRIKEIEKQKIEAELQALKAQVNPHFFFNTLNSLYSLSLDKSDKAPELILKLSELMRFVIYDSRDDFVTMERQLEFMKSYVYLERLRMDEHLKLTFTVTGSNLQIRIAPLIFIAFIENAFKHVSKTIPDPYIMISFDLEKTDSVHFTVENSRDPVMSNPVNSGLGLSNVRQRLNLLYPDMHELKLEEKPDTYRVELTINH